MARTAEFSDDQIIEAGRKLVAAGKRITGFGLRNAVGGGNPNRLLQIWETHQFADSGEKHEVISELPMELAEHLETIIGNFTIGFSEQFTRIATDMHHRSVKASERRVREMTEAAQEKEEKAKAEIEDASAAVEKAEADLEKSQNLAADLERRLEKSQESERQKDFEIKQLKKDLETLEKSSSKAADDASKEIGKLSGQVSKLETQLAESKDRASSLDGELKVSRIMQEDSRKEIAEWKRDSAIKHKENGALTEKIESQRLKIEELKETINEEREIAVSIENDYKEVGGKLLDSQAKVEELSAELKKRDEEIAALKADPKAAKKAEQDANNPGNE